MKIFVDTNVFLHFYNSNLDKLETLSEVLKIKKNIIISKLTYDEFLRNREHILQQMKKSVQDICITPYQTSIIKEANEMKEINTIRQRLKDLTSSLVSKIDDYLIHPENDPVYSNFIGLSEYFVPYTDELVVKAHTRKLVGNPPTTDKKKTICDELHWEILLSTAKDNLIIVTRDDGFLNNSAFLKNEFNNITGLKLEITPKLTEAMIMVGETPSSELKRVDEITVKIEYGWIPPGAHLIACEEKFLVLRINGEIKRYWHYTNDLRDLCPSCQHFGPWNGARCMSCGQCDCE
jgi:predicted nucleic acid-binding protein